MNDNELRNERLVLLSQLKDYEVAKDNINVTGWRVVGADGEKLGDVKDLVVDMEAMKVRYLSVLGDNRFFERDRDTYLLIPIGAAALDRKGKNIFVASVDGKSISQYPAYPGGAITPDYEYAVRDNFRRAHRDTFEDKTEYKSEFDDALHTETDNTRRINPDFYNDESFNEERFYTAGDPGYDRDAHTRRVTDHSDSKDYRGKSVEDSITTIERLENLRERGSITEEEFILLKKRALDS
ncbi:PRC-barrel domain-containing protein [Pontibacter sp. HSC-14F20]|uniref:PRC-barrel domain-containing protein n=1 Tax=Pontibacter sp. HSC-14F20 TaxID=2864136 RepID=UPI001C72E5AB|nr:PRC-barrel domain-containing protein [Pontibacter sp. HSC-14F20]MBX0331850.1 PRC-barrel domain-containing protein [Pontibacter sp. HSC-14F20]